MHKKLLGLVAVIAIAGGAWYIFTDKTTPKQPTFSSKKEIVALINGKEVSLNDIKKFASTIPQLAELPFEMVYPQLLETMINTKVLLTAAEEAHIQDDPNIKRNIELARDQILSQSYLMKKLEAMMTDEKLKELYDTEIKSYTPQEEIKARHILLGSKKEADDILIQLKAGADFETLANTKSLDTENKGGELGYFTKSMMIPEFGEAVFELKKGQLSAPIKTPFGYHVVLVEDKRLASPPEFEDVKEQLKQTFMDQNAKNIIAQEREKMKVKILKPTLIEKKQELKPVASNEETAQNNTQENDVIEGQTEALSE